MALPLHPAACATSQGVLSANLASQHRKDKTLENMGKSLLNTPGTSHRLQTTVAHPQAAASPVPCRPPAARWPCAKPPSPRPACRTPLSASSNPGPRSPSWLLLFPSASARPAQPNPRPLLPLPVALRPRLSDMAVAASCSPPAQMMRPHHLPQHRTPSRAEGYVHSVTHRGPDLGRLPLSPRRKDQTGPPAMGSQRGPDPGRLP